MAGEGHQSPAILINKTLRAGDTFGYHNAKVARVEANGLLRSAETKSLGLGQLQVRSHIQLGSVT